MLPNKIIIQWHVTDSCNLRCKHCYQENYTNQGVDFNTLIIFLDKIYTFYKICKQENPDIKFHINFTGGEPFIRTDFIDFIEIISAKKFCSFGILSNGFLLHVNDLERLKKLKPGFVQISLEGNKAINDEIRGEGSYMQITKALTAYKKLKIPVIISFTANSQNYKYFGDVVKIGIKYKVAKVWTDRYLPVKENDELELTTKQTKEFFKIILKEQNKNKLRFFSKTQIDSNRALQFLICGGEPYKCSAGNSLISILSNGDIVPCRRMPIKIGNMLTDDLTEIYFKNSILAELRNPEKKIENCSECFYKIVCNGGLKCLSFIKNQSPFSKDPNCWI